MQKMKDYKSILKANDPITIETTDGHITLSETGNDYNGQVAKQLWSDVKRDKLKQPEILEFIDN